MDVIYVCSEAARRGSASRREAKLLVSFRLAWLLYIVGFVVFHTIVVLCLFLLFPIGGSLGGLLPSPLFFGGFAFDLIFGSILFEFFLGLHASFHKVQCADHD